MEKSEDFKSVTGGVLPSGLMKSYRERLENDLGFISRSRHMKQIASTFSEYSASKQSLTIVGAMGTGRGTLANAMHLSGADWWRPFIEADLSKFDERKALKLLFGHKEGRLFSSAGVQPGLIQIAEKSTLCLKNFDGYPKKVQRELFKLRKGRVYSPVACEDKKPVECRLVFTLRGLPENLAKVGHIDEDISKMLSEKVIVVPPLSKRRDDIVPLAAKFIYEWSSEFHSPIKKLSKEGEKWLKKAPWNGNVIQLKKSVYAACMNTEDRILEPKHFALAHEGNLRDYQQKQLEELSIQTLIEKKLETFLSRLGKFEASDLYEAIMDRVEEPLLKLVLNYAGGNQIKASRMLGINRNTLRTKVNKYGIKIDRGEK